MKNSQETTTEEEKGLYKDTIRLITEGGVFTGLGDPDTDSK